jgi:hypothetical protein
MLSIHPSIHDPQTVTFWYISISCCPAAADAHILSFAATFFNKNNKDLTQSDMDIIHEILTEPEPEEESSVSDEQELLEDDRIKPQTQLQDMNPAQVPVVETTTPVIRRPSSAGTHSTPRGVRRVRGGAASAALLERLKVGMYFAVWYALNIVYNGKFVLGDCIDRCVVGTYFFINSCSSLWFLSTTY